MYPMCQRVSVEKQGFLGVCELLPLWPRVSQAAEAKLEADLVGLGWLRKSSQDQNGGGRGARIPSLDTRRV